jgi:hypothetical protein
MLRGTSGGEHLDPSTNESATIDRELWGSQIPRELQSGSKKELKKQRLGASTEILFIELCSMT